MTIKQSGPPCPICGWIRGLNVNCKSCRFHEHRSTIPVEKYIKKYCTQCEHPEGENPDCETCKPLRFDEQRKKNATIERLPGIKNNAHAVFADALGSTVIDAPALALWIDTDGLVRWTSSSSNQESMWMLQTMINTILNPK